MAFLISQAGQSRIFNQPGGFRGNPVIAVHKLYVSAPCQIQRPVSGIGDAGGRFVEHPDQGIPGVVGITDGGGGIRRFMRKFPVSAVFPAEVLDRQKKDPVRYNSDI